MTGRPDDDVPKTLRATLGTIREQVLNRGEPLPRESVRALLLHLLQAMLEESFSNQRRSWDTERLLRQEMALLQRDVQHEVA